MRVVLIAAYVLAACLWGYGIYTAQGVELFAWIFAALCLSTEAIRAG